MSLGKFIAAKTWLDTIIDDGILVERAGYIEMATLSAQTMLRQGEKELADSLLVTNGEWAEWAIRWTVGHSISGIDDSLSFIVWSLPNRLSPKLIPEVHERLVHMIALLETVEMIPMPTTAP